MTDHDDLLARMRAVNAASPFNAWLGLDLISVGEGAAELRLNWRPEFGQYAGFMHAGIISGLLDTACAFAAASIVGPVLASHVSVNCLAPAVGDAFTVRGTVQRAGRRQIFTRAELFARRGDGPGKLVATGDTILLPAETPNAAAG